MLNNYLKIAIRNIVRQKLYSFINITGLSVGIAASILIMLYVWHELSFDRFHSKADRTYRVVMDNFNLNANGEFVKSKSGWTQKYLASALKEELPEILHVTRLTQGWHDIEFTYNGKMTFETGASRNTLYADSSVFDVFDIPLVHGDPKTALNEPHSIVFTEEMAMKYFGEEDPLGKIVHVETRFLDLDLIVTGVAKAMPENSHFDFSYIVPYDLREYPSTFTYITLPKDYDPEDLEAKLPLIVNKYFVPEYEKTNRMTMTWDEYVESGMYPKLHLQPLRDIYLGSYSTSYSRSGNITYVYLFSTLAFFILLLACVNFMTLSTARSGSRAKEVGVRKISGASRGQLIRQFLTESILITVIALMGALILVKLFLPAFSKFLGMQITPDFSEIGLILFTLLAIILTVGILAGSYPAFFLSVFRPVTVFKGTLPARSRGLSLRNSLVVFQFIISIVLIVASITVHNQLSYMRKKDPGYNKEHIIIINNIQEIMQQDRDNQREEREQYWKNYHKIPQDERRGMLNLYPRAETFRQELLKHSQVLNASICANLPGMWTRLWTRDFRLEGHTDYKNINYSLVDPAYCEVFDIKFIAGNNFSWEMSSNRQRGTGIILNEKAVKHLGLEDPVGKNLNWRNRRPVVNDDGGDFSTREDYDISIPVIGVVKDFHNRSFKSEIQPIGLIFLREGPTRRVAVKVKPGDMQASLAFMEETWNKFVTRRPFEYSFFDEDFNSLYREEERLGKIFTFFTALAIFIACLGIFGLAAFNAEQRTKEIGIRKVVGASVRSIVGLLSIRYIKLVIIANLLAWPIAYFAMNKWLQDFAYHIDLGFVIFGLTGLIALFIVLLSVSSNAFRAARANPVVCLKYE